MFYSAPHRYSYIYVLCDPRTHSIRYVGRTTKLMSRFSSHLLPENLTSSTPKNDWINDLLAHELEPEMLILSHVPHEESAYWEQYWIDRLRSLGVDLLNARDAHKLRSTKKLGFGRSGYLGVRWREQSQRWYAAINVDKKLIYLGVHDDPEVLARRYDEAAKFYLGEKARLNFPD